MEFHTDTWNGHDLTCVELNKEPGVFFYDAYEVLSLFVRSRRQRQTLMKQVEHAGLRTFKHNDILYVMDNDLGDFVLKKAFSKKVPVNLAESFNDHLQYGVESSSPAKRERKRKRNNAPTPPPSPLQFDSSEHEDDDDQHDDGDPPAVVAEQLSLKDVARLSKMMLNSAMTLRALQDVEPKNDLLEKRLLVQIENAERRIEANTTLYPPGEWVRVSQRIREMEPQLSRKTIKRIRQEVGAVAADLHMQHYGVQPMRTLAYVGKDYRPINVYTEETAPHTLDLAIEHVLEEMSTEKSD